MSLNIGRLQHTNITDEMKRSYLNYAMSVIVARALPDVRDGLKPVHRRILYAMNEMGLGPSAKFLKSARIVGETMGKYHPHGNMAIYDSLVRLAQDFSMRYPLIWGQGNFGSIDGDPPAADRYTEAKLQAISMELLTDLDKDTVDFGPNYDASFQEPLYLPAKLPNLLLMGAEGIAVGMATKIPPHNITEVIDAIIFTIGRTKIGAPAAGEGLQNAVQDLANKELGRDEGPTITTNAVETPTLGEPQAALSSDVTIDELLEFVKGPDFPTAGSIYDITEIKNAYITGRGKIVIRGKAEIEEIGNGKSAITITELPYQVNKAMLIAKIADLAKDKKIDGISDLRDESDRRGLRIYVELKRDATPKKVLNNLFKQTSLQTTFPVNMVALVDGTPQTLNLKLILEEYLKHRYIVIRRRTEFELKQAKARLHILEGLKIAVDHIDAVIATIRASKDQESAKTNLMDKFKLSEIQSTAILDMQLRRLAALERQKIEDELLMVKETIAYLEDLLAHGDKILSVIKDELLKLKEKYADPRRTKVFKGKVGEFSEEDLIPNEPTVITLTTTGYIKRQNLSSFQTQHRGGKGISGMKVKDEDSIQSIRYAQTHDNIIFFTNKGKAYQLRAYEIAESSRISKGSAIVNLLNIEAGEIVQSFIVLDKKLKEGNIFLTTRNGTVKKSSLGEFENIRRNGMIAIKLDPDDELVWSKITDGKSQILIVTKNGKAIKFSETEVRPLGRATMGVRGIKIDKTDEVISMDVISKGDKADLFAIMENGLGKKTPVEQFPLQGRGGQGVKVARVTDRSRHSPNHPSRKRRSHHHIQKGSSRQTGNQFNTKTLKRHPRRYPHEIFPHQRPSRSRHLHRKNRNPTNPRLVMAELRSCFNPDVIREFDTSILLLTRGHKVMPAVYPTSEGNVSLLVAREPAVKYWGRRALGKTIRRHITAVQMPPTDRVPDPDYSVHSLASIYVHETFPTLIPGIERVIYKVSADTITSQTGKIMRQELGPTFPETATKEMYLSGGPTAEMIAEDVFPSDVEMHNVLHTLRTLRK